MEILKVEDVFKDLPELNTQRLLLRRVRLGDAADMFEYASDPEVTRELTWQTHRTIEDSKAFLDFTMGKYGRGEVSDWGIVLKETNKFIGMCGFVWWRPEHAKAEVGYVLSRKYWGRGLMSEALAAMIDFAFDRMRLNRLELACVDTNIGSERVMQKNGLKYEGLSREAVFEKGRFKNHKRYSLLRSDRQTQAGLSLTETL